MKPVSDEVLAKLQRLAECRGEAHVALLIRTVIESEGNEQAFIEPVIRAVSDVMHWHPERTRQGTPNLAALRVNASV